MKHVIHIWWKRDNKGEWFINRTTTDLRNWDGSTLTEHDVFETVEVKEPEKLNEVTGEA